MDDTQEITINFLDIHEEGQDAAWSGVSFCDNPYPPGSEAAMTWEDGFKDMRD